MSMLSVVVTVRLQLATHKVAWPIIHQIRATSGNARPEFLSSFQSTNLEIAVRKDKR